MRTILILTIIAGMITLNPSAFAKTSEKTFAAYELKINKLVTMYDIFIVVALAKNLLDEGKIDAAKFNLEMGMHYILKHRIVSKELQELREKEFQDALDVVDAFLKIGIPKSTETPEPKE